MFKVFLVSPIVNLLQPAVSENILKTHGMAERDLEESKMILEFSDNGFFLTDRYFSGLFSHYLQEQLEIK